MLRLRRNARLCQQKQWMSLQFQTFLNLYARGPLVDKIGITPENVGQSIDKWLLYGSQLCRLFQLNELKLTIPQKARLYHYYIPVFVWCEDQIALHNSKFKDGDDVPPLVVRY